VTDARADRRCGVINRGEVATTGKRVGFVGRDTDDGEDGARNRSGLTGRVMRGQTTLDFAIGVSLFLAVVLFTFTFVPTVLEPFDVVAEDNPTMADRTADNLANGQLGAAAQPHALEWHCTVAFFAGDSSPSDCNYQGQTLDERLDLDIGQGANVTVARNGDISQLLCWSEDPDSTPDGEPGLTNASASDCESDDTTLAIGENRPEDQDTAIASRRVVSLYGETVVLEVVLW
jgi:hypothetical protein